MPTAGLLDPTFGAGGKVTTDLFPHSIPTYSFAQAVQTDGKIVITKLLVLLGLAKSGNEARRHVESGGVTIR